MKKLGKFEIIEKVGQGAMGVVYKARDPFIDRIVALKTLTTGLADDANLLKRFYSEARSAGGLQHPNIVTIYELGHEGDTPFIAMQFLSGESLDKILDRRPNLPLSQKLGFIVYVCRALEYAHKQNPPVVHRDIKPGNVMVTLDGAVLVVDFGIARLGEGTRSQSAGMLIGTLGYMSPQLFRNGAADARSDIWATGVMFYELLAYRRPFEGDNAAALMSNIILEKPRSLAEAAPDTPTDVNAVVDRMLAKDAEARYQSMEEVLMELEPIWRRLQQADVSNLLENTQQLFEAGNLENAKSNISQIIQMDPSNSMAKSLLEKINAEFKRKQIVPQVRALVENAGQLLASGQVEDAKAKIEAALKLDSTFQPAREVLGQVQAAIDRNREITQALRTSKQRMAEGALTEAELQLDKVLEIDPGNAAAREQLKQIREERSRRERRKQRDDALHRARTFWTNLQYEECINLLLSAQRQFPGDSEITKLLESARQDQAEQQRQSLLTEARNLLSAQRFDDSLRALDRLLERYPSDATAKNLRTHALQGREQQSRDQRLAEGKSKLRAWVKEGKYPEAINYAGQLSKEFPDDFELKELLDFARTELSQLEQKRRLEQYSKQIQQALKDGRFSESIQSAEKALLEFPKNLDLLILLDRGKKEQSEKERHELLKQRFREVERMVERQELTDAIDLARQTLATVGQDPRIVGALLKAQKELEFREQKKRRQDETVRMARTLFDAGKPGDATSILKDALAAQLFSSDDSRVTQLLKEIDAKKRPPPSPPPSIPKAPIAPEPAPATRFGESFSSPSKGDPGKDYIYMHGSPMPEAPASQEQHATAAAASATSFGSSSVQPISPPPSDLRIADMSATSFSPPAVEQKPWTQDLTVTLPVQERPKPIVEQTRTEPRVREAPLGQSIGDLLRKPAVLVAAGAVLVLGIVVTAYVIWPKPPTPPAPTPEEIALEKDAAQLREAHHFHDALAKYKAIVDLRGAEAPVAAKEIESINQFLTQENSLMQQAKVSEDGSNLTRSRDEYQQVVDLKGEREADARAALKAVVARINGASAAQIAMDSYTQGLNEYNRREYPAAKSSFEEALNRGPQNWPKRPQAGDYLRKSENRVRQEQRLKQAQTFFNLRNYDEAKKEGNAAASTPDGDPLVNKEATDLIASIPKPPVTPVEPPAKLPGPPAKNYAPVISAVRAAINQGQWSEAARRLQELPASQPEFPGLNDAIGAGRNEDNTFSAKLDEFHAAELGKNETALRTSREYFNGVASQNGRHSSEAGTVITKIDADLRSFHVTPPQPPRDYAADVMAAVRQYAAAVTKGDIDQVKSVRDLRPEEEKKFKDNFKGHGIPTTLSNCTVPEVNGESAKVTCSVVSGKDTPAHPATYSLIRLNGRWRIVGSN
jgi:eukaryotic-like serine/threonine-protein kinase